MTMKFFFFECELKGAEDPQSSRTNNASKRFLENSKKERGNKKIEKDYKFNS